jgi:hypothetical protein
MRNESRNSCLRTGLAVFILLSAARLPIPAAKGAASRNNEPQCAHWAILRSCQLLGAPVDITTLMRMLSPRRQGHNMLDMARVLERIGLDVEARIEQYDVLISRSFPAIVHMNPGHFAVVSNASIDYVVLFDGFGHRRTLTAKTFKDNWTGRLLRVSRPLDDRPLPAFSRPATQRCPSVRFDTLLIDKGEVASVGEPVTFVFPFQNLGEADLLIQKVIPDCTCLSFNAPKDPVPPGAKDAITLQYRLKDAEGPFYHEACVKSNDPVVPIVKLAATGNTNQKIRMAPKRVNFGTIAPGNTRTATCFIRYTGDTPLAGLYTTCDVAGVSIEASLLSDDYVHNHWPGAEAKVIMFSSNTHVLKVSYTPPKDTFGEMRGAIYIHTNIERFKKITLPFVGRVVRPVQLDPDQLLFTAASSNEECQQTVTARALYGRPFKVVAVDSAQTGLECAYSPEMAHEVLLTFHGNIGRLLQDREQRIRVHAQMCDLPEKIMLDLPICAILFEK